MANVWPGKQIFDIDKGLDKFIPERSHCKVCMWGFQADCEMLNGEHFNPMSVMTLKRNHFRPIQ